MDCTDSTDRVEEIERTKKIQVLMSLEKDSTQSIPINSEWHRKTFNKKDNNVVRHIGIANGLSPIICPGIGYGGFLNTKRSMIGNTQAIY